MAPGHVLRLSGYPGRARLRRLRVVDFPAEAALYQTFREVPEIKIADGK
jgi:hypothetical protein